MSRLPRSIKIVVHDGRNLDYRVPGSKKTPQTRRWRVIFIGGEKKQATGIVDEQDGFPRWDCEVLITTPKPVDSVRMLVLDGKERDVGQVVIHLPSDLPWPPAPPPPLVTSQLHVRDLGPTKHNPTPCGQLSFWIWALDYWPEGTTPVAVAALGAPKHAIRGSLSNLGAAIKSSHHGSSAGSTATGGGDNHSRLGTKLRDIKNRVSTKGSVVGDRNHNQQQAQQPLQEEGSVIMGASIISSHPGLGPMGWASANSELSGGVPGSGGMDGQIIGAGANYNPLATGESEEEYTHTGRASNSLYASGETQPTPAAGRELWNASEGELPKRRESQNNGYQGKSRRKAVVNHIRNKISRSSANLSELGNKIRSRRSSPDGSRGEQDSKVPMDEPSMLLPQMRLETRPIVQHTDTGLVPNPRYAETMVKEEWSLPSTQSVTSPLKALPKNTPAAASYGLHPEEAPGKSKEDMSKRELIELANLLEERLLSTRTELVRANMEQNQLSAQMEDLNSELNDTRTQLSSLRNRLLEDNLTQYLEVSVGESSNASLNRTVRPEQLTTFQSHPANQNGTTVRSPTGSFLSRAKALASRSFGGALSGSTSQPNLTNSLTSPKNSVSQSSPPLMHAGTVDYGSVW